MAVYKQNYGTFRGALTPTWSRFLILPRYLYRDVFQSRLFVAFFTFCFLTPVAGLVAIYLHHNLAVLKIPFIQGIAASLPINNAFFKWGLDNQGSLCFLLALFVGPALISPDLRNNGLPLYLSRPFSRSEYVLGKMTVLVILMSLITWIPGLLLFLFQAYLEGGGWLRENWSIAFALFAGSWIWIVVLSLLSLAISAWVKWKPVARVTLMSVFFVLFGFSRAFNEWLDTWWGSLLSLWVAMENVWAALFGMTLDSDLTVPLWAAGVTLTCGCLLSLWLLSRRIQAYEVVR